MKKPPPLAVQQTLTGHRGPVHVARYSQGTATYVLSGGQDRTVKLWNASSGAEIKSFNAHGYEVLTVSVAFDNAKFASAGGDRSVFIWDVASGNTIRRLSGHLAKIHAVEFNQDATVVASASYDATVRLYDLRSQNTHKPIQILDEAKDAVQSIHMGPTYITTGSVDGHIRTYDLRKGELRVDYIGHPITSIVPTPDSSTYLTTTLSSTIFLMDTTTGKCLQTFKGHSNSSYHCRACFGANEESVICGDEEGKIWGWDLVTGQVIPNMGVRKEHKKLITWTEYRPVNDANEMVTAGADGVVKVWRA